MYARSLIFFIFIKKCFLCCDLAGYSTLPRSVSNGPTPEELEQQRRYLQASSNWNLPFYFSLLILIIRLPHLIRNQLECLSGLISAKPKCHVSSC